MTDQVAVGISRACLRLQNEFLDAEDSAIAFNQTGRFDQASKHEIMLANSGRYILRSPGLLFNPVSKLSQRLGFAQIQAVFQ